ncbi:hypothetical protein ACFOLJ_17910 [Rugamonas sp. CCM 8940]|uniref:hypothetical protein n=1 Tax=Rugamonas sp. CCM 8940 TaxID=2765359 RepID=UPI001F331722|nr:hypothetical protein [Rugamonas sp. CCM 8940]
MRQKNIIAASLGLAGLLALSACGGGDSNSNSPGGKQPAGAPPPPSAFTLAIDFNKGIDGWSSGTADYTAETKPTEVKFAFEPLPAPLSGNGYFIGAHNNSDDVLVYVKKQFAGFAPSTKYKLSFDLRFASDIASGCYGVGGSPGDAVHMLAVASPTEPLTELQANGEYRLNIERGNQAANGQFGKVLGTLGNGTTDCFTRVYVSKLVKSAETMEVQSDAQGKLWVLFGMDSGFEASGRAILQSANVSATPL